MGVCLPNIFLNGTDLIPCGTDLKAQPAEGITIGWHKNYGVINDLSIDRTEQKKAGQYFTDADFLFSMKWKPKQNQ